MKFAYLSLTNYIGIYNGLGLTNIAIDFTRCKYRTVVIKGANGSGKSTIMNSLNVFPDGNECFIPNAIAKKEIVLMDGPISYKLTFVHGIKPNGERDTTKAYIAKSENGMIKELNPNGNVSSYKDILYEELNLDPNFTALSQLSLEDRGLADKRPAERKRFVNSIIESLDVYNNIYKTLSKKSSNFKNMISAIVAKLGNIGDIEVLRQNLDGIENRINIKQDEKDKAVEQLAQQKSTIQLLDPDGKIQIRYNELIDSFVQVEIKRDKLIDLINDKLFVGFDWDQVKSLGEFIPKLERTISEKKSAIDTAKSQLQFLMQQREEESNYLLSKSRRLQSISGSENYEMLMDRLGDYLDRVKNIEMDVAVTGITLGSITKAEYIVALETLKEIGEIINLFKDTIPYDILEEVVGDYLDKRVDPAIGYQSNLSVIGNDVLNRITEIDTEMILIRQSLDNAQKLVNRPDKCKFDDCYFIKDAVDFMNTNPNGKLKALQSEKASIEDQIKNNEELTKRFSQKQTAIRYIYQIIRHIEKNGDILKKIGIFNTPEELFDGVLSGKNFDYMRNIYQYIDLANLFDEYNHINGIITTLQNEISILDSKKDIIDELVAQVEELRIKVSRLEHEIGVYNHLIKIHETELKECTDRLEYYIEIHRIDMEIEKYESIMAQYDAELNSINDKTSRITQCINVMADMRDRIAVASNELVPLMAERDKLNHAIRMVEDYNNELDQLRKRYDFIEKIKYYSSPTTGIQLVFMELYMGTIISLANELLSFLFNGKFKIQPFIINESEFRIPCMGEGYLNDDISSMSSAQISMISMILSFALLHHSSTKYNIIKLDEIDGPLDEVNRIMFIDVLDRIMNIMGTEQAIMISHNTELQMETSDIILLRPSSDSPDYIKGNIIWKYQ